MSEQRSIDEDRSDGIWALIEAATPGPWEVRQIDDGRFYGQPPTFDVVSVADDRQEAVAAGGFAEDGGPSLGAAEGPDAEFIVAARELVPLLLSEADRLRAQIQAAEALATEWYAERGAADGYPVADQGRGFASASRLCADELRAALAAVPVDSTEEKEHVDERD